MLDWSRSNPLIFIPLRKPSFFLNSVFYCPCVLFCFVLPKSPATIQPFKLTVAPQMSPERFPQAVVAEPESDAGSTQSPFLYCLPSDSTQVCGPASWTNPAWDLDKADRGVGRMSQEGAQEEESMQSSFRRTWPEWLKRGKCRTGAEIMVTEQVLEWSAGQVP